MRKSGLGAAVLGAIGLGLLMMGGGGRRRRRVVGERPGAEVPFCDLTPAEAARWLPSREARRDWLLCDGRTPTDAASFIAAAPEEERPALRDLWNTRRAVEDAPPDGEVRAPDARARVDAAAAPTPPRDVPPEPEAAPRGRVTLPTEADVVRDDSAPNPADRPGYDPDRARALAGPLARRLRTARPGQYRGNIREFQTAAGLVADGIYGGTTYNALRYYGIAASSLARPHQPPSPDDPRAEYAPRPRRAS